MVLDLGYIGSAIPFIISIAIILLAEKGVIPLSMPFASKLAFVITAIWWIVFTIPMLKDVYTGSFYSTGIKYSWRKFQTTWRTTFKEIRKYRTVFLFLMAYFFYIDGVGTIISMSTAYGTDLGISATVASNYIVCHSSSCCSICNSLRAIIAKVYGEKDVIRWNIVFTSSFVFMRFL